MKTAYNIIFFTLVALAIAAIVVMAFAVGVMIREGEVFVCLASGALMVRGYNSLLGQADKLLDAIRNWHK